jgi:hypothetical protein
MVNKERVELFAQALESNQYVQCTKALRKPARSIDRDSILAWNHCAAGVAIDVALKNGFQLTPKQFRAGGELWLWNHGSLPEPIMDWYGFESVDPEIVIDDGDGPFKTEITGANDDGADFWTIAQAIRAQYLKEEG